MSKKVAYGIAAAGGCLTLAALGLAWWVTAEFKTEVTLPMADEERRVAVVQEKFEQGVMRYEVPEDIIAVPQVEPKQPKTPTLPLPQKTEELPRYILNATPFNPVNPKAGKIVIVIDDVGVVEKGARQALLLPPEVTLSFLPYGEFTPDTVTQARILGHEVMIHLPMEPKQHADGTQANPGPKALYTGMKPEEIKDLARANIVPLAAISVGVNNHMGSAFTEWKEGMEAVLEVVQDERLFYMDSVTTPHSAVDAAAQGMSLPILHRNVFLDHIQTVEFVAASLAKLEKMAQENGFAVGIGHPHEVTLKTIAVWAQSLDPNKVVLAPVSALLTQTAPVAVE